jgi:hypothetical protein
VRTGTTKNAELIDTDWEKEATLVAESEFVRDSGCQQMETCVEEHRVQVV